MDMLVSTQWLADQLGAPDLVILDASSHLPDAGRDPAAEYRTAHIPGALYLDLPNLKDPDSPVPYALPTPAQFAARMGELGISETDRIFIYDDSDVKTSARAWFTARMNGAKHVAILDGGLGKWRAEGRPLESGTDAPRTGSFTPSGGPGDVRSKADILANLDSRAEQLVDARGSARFRGEAPDFRPGVAEGHIPGSANLPFGMVLNKDGTFKDEAGIRAAFADAGIDLDRPVVTTCGGGVTAAVLLFAMELIGKRDTALYDGSWTEWGADPETPKAKGASS
ncbi:3-mercaptopyruvate sulfurtransferase [Croceibacterium atlanticum]|uniref:3-mercaptopyruvate sulfurtransferase n=1 Tax=Croceibacterium atlanticum TaxID=1267766 RepID=A0A0F7KPB3_9SPHN|nr:sulfurtransferase [Croceibacterium atlanticum]AKH42363.1 3-mercaptopyruvate sulfurtransferase [Croceibacterium atlanticum]